MTDDEAFEIEYEAYCRQIRDSYLSMAETTEQVAEQGGKYREMLLGFARGYREAADRFSEEARDQDAD